MKRRLRASRDRATMPSIAAALHKTRRLRGLRDLGTLASIAAALHRRTASATVARQWLSAAPPEQRFLHRDFRAFPHFHNPVWKSSPEASSTGASLTTLHRKSCELCGRVCLEIYSRKTLLRSCGELANNLWTIEPILLKRLRKSCGFPVEKRLKSCVKPDFAKSSK
jgi:hypothetical protein